MSGKTGPVFSINWKIPKVFLNHQSLSNKKNLLLTARKQGKRAFSLLTRFYKKVVPVVAAERERGDFSTPMKAQQTVSKISGH